MRPEIRDFLQISRAQLTACLLVFCCTTAWTNAGQVIRFTAADMLVTNVSSFSSTTTAIDPGSLSGSWTLVNLPHKFAGSPALGVNIPAKTSAPAPMTTTWYRVKLEGFQPSTGTMHLYLSHWQAAGEIAVYGDGRLLYRSIGTAAWNFFRHPPLFIPLTLTPEAAPPKEILVRIDSEPGTGIAISSVYAGDTDALYSQYSTRVWFEYQLPFLSSGAFLAIGFFALAVWIIRRREHLYFLVFAIAVLSATRRWHFYAGLEKLHISDQWFAWIIFNALVWQIVANHFFLVLLHGRSRPWLSRSLIGIGIVVTVMSLPWFSVMTSLVQAKPQSYFGQITMAIILIALNSMDAWRSRSREAGLLVGTTLLTVLFGTYDWLNGVYKFSIEGFHLLPYGATTLFAAVTYIMFRRYMGAIAEVERVNASLEQRLQAREVELIASHERLREIEQRQMLSHERQRLMQDMHDGLGSSLTSALRVVERGQLGKTDIAQVLMGCIDDLKLAIDSMEPLEADLLLLLATLRFRLGPRLESTGIFLRWQVKNVPALNWLDPRNALHILRILQEAITNIIQHTHATEIRVATRVENDDVVVTISDNGQGFELEHALHGGGKGLSNQRRRAQAIGARICWDSTSAGTCLSLWLPQQRAAT